MIPPAEPDPATARAGDTGESNLAPSVAARVTPASGTPTVMACGWVLVGLSVTAASRRW
jgi:hypothetical protein